MQQHYQAMKFSRTLALLLLFLAAYWSFHSLMPNYNPDADSAPNSFSNDRALSHVKSLSIEPHAVGFPGHARTRAYIISELNKMGLETTIQEGYTAGDWANLSKATNILARIKGSGNGKALLLLSHYDSSPHSSLGASDAGSGVATILEGIRAFLAEGNTPKNDIIILISDAEELGLNGVALTAEVQYTLHDGGTYGEKRVIKAGVNHHTGDFNKFDSDEMANGHTSYYVLADIGVYSEGEGSNQGLSIFGSYIYNADDEVAGLTNFYNIGAVYRGLIPGRDKDKLGVNFVYAKHSKYNTYTHNFVSGLIRGNESILEIDYNYYLPYGIQIMPDFQYIKHPNGSVDFDNAVIAGLKFNVNF